MVGAAVLLAASACTGGTSTPSAENIAAQIDADLVTYLEAADSYGKVRAVLVYHEGEPLLERYTGASAEDHLDTQAVGESVMSALIGIAIDQGHLEGVDQTLGDLLPDYATAMTPSVAAITLRQVLSQSAGFPADSTASRHNSSGSLSTVNTYRESDNWVRTLLVDRASSGSGSGDFADSDAGAHLLSAILVRATGQSVLEYARENLVRSVGDTDGAGLGVRTGQRRWRRRR